MATNSQKAYGQSSVLDSELECSICQDRLKDPRKLDKCGHIFCSTCIKDWIKKLNTQGNKLSCPECRRESSKNLQPVDRRLLNILARLEDLDKNKKPICEICKLIPQDSGCERCGKLTCAYCVSRCGKCQETLCPACTSTHVRLIKVDVMDMLNDVTMAQSTLDNEVEFIKTEILRLKGSRSSILKNREIFRIKNEKQKELLEEALEALKIQRQRKLEEMQQEEEKLKLWINTLEEMLNGTAKNGTDDTMKRLMQTKDEAELVEMKTQLNDTTESLTAIQNFDSAQIPIFAGYAVLGKLENADIVESLLPLSARQKEELLMPTKEDEQEVDVVVSELLLESKHTCHENCSCESQVEKLLSKSEADIAFNALLRFQPTGKYNIINIICEECNTYDFDAFLHLLIKYAKEAYKRRGLVYNRRKVLARLQRTEWRYRVSLEDLPMDEESVKNANAQTEGMGYDVQVQPRAQQGMPLMARVPYLPTSQKPLQPARSIARPYNRPTPSVINWSLGSKQVTGEASGTPENVLKSCQVMPTKSF